MNLFRGYIPSNGKIPLYSVATYELLEEPPTEGDYVGVLKPYIIQVDIDDYELAQTLLKIIQEYKIRCDILETSRGLHFYFKDNGRVKSQKVGWYNAIGIPTDYGLGNKARVVPLRITKRVERTRIVNGKEVGTISIDTITRQWLQTYDEIEELPCWLIPVSNRNLGVLEITTRNQSLFNYILTLQSVGLNKDEIRKTIKIINRNILLEPLPDKEVDTITRDEAFAEELFFGEHNKFLHDRFGNYMLTNCNIVSIDNLTHIYTQNGIYSSNQEEFERMMVDKIPCLKSSQRKEVYDYITLKCNKHVHYASAKYVGLANTILDLETMNELPYSPEWVIPNKIPYPYNPKAYCELMDKTINKLCCNDKELRLLLEEMMGYCLYRQNSLQVCFILTGEGSNGKSTLLNLLKKLIGKDNFTSLDPREFDDTFKPAELHNKLANFGDDISSRYIENSSIFKKLVTGESFMVQKKYAQPFELESYATQIFCANEMPRVNDISDGFGRRLVLIPFNARFTKEDNDYDPFIEEKLMSDESMEYLLKISIEGLRRIVFNKRFQASKSAEKEKREYIKINNPIEEWLDDEPKIENESINDVYLAYKVWCVSNGCTPMKKANVGRAIKSRFGFVSKPRFIDGRTIRIYCKDEEDE